MAASLTLGAVAGSPDPHWLPLPSGDDPDADLLTTVEETILGKDPANPDEDGNEQPDGADLAWALSLALDALPTASSSVQPYVQHHMAFGLENCQVCGAVTNMGFLSIVNPLENQSADVPYIAKHFLEHGSFAYSGTVHSGRLNAPLLHNVITSVGLGHFMQELAASDSDADGLRNWEETAFQCDPVLRDTDDDQVIDGIDTARALRMQLDALPRAGRPEQGPKDRPFIVEHPMDGVETCPGCGDRVVMDIWDVINPVTKMALSIPSMALHYLEHGGCSWCGGQLMGGQGRVDPLQLKAVLTGQGGGHLLPVTLDADGDLLSDVEEGDLGTNPQVPDEDRNQVPDGIDLARKTAGAIAVLPVGPVTAPGFRLDFPLRGLERCDICGTNVNMGHLTVCNPLAQLYAKVPYIALHYLEHGSFSFAGDVHGKGRNEVRLLVDALHSSGPSHLLPVTGDTDGDGLRDVEESHFHLDKTLPDTDGDGVPDGFALADGFSDEITVLPRTTNPECYVVEHPLRGTVTCATCGATVNMGWLDVVNPREHLTVTVPYLAMHYLRHGSFAWSAQDRLNPCLLDIALHGDGTSHLVLWPGDTDGDGLLDSEETHFGLRIDVPDSDGSGVLDGVALARALRERIKTLPTSPNGGTYMIPYEANCFAPCPVCGENFNCGHVRITNTWAGLSLEVSYMNLHFLEHGSFAVSATERVDPVRLDAILQPAVLIVGGESQVILRWQSRAGHNYQLFTASDVAGPWRAGPVFHGDGTQLEFTEDQSTGTTRTFYKIVASQPDELP